MISYSLFLNKNVYFDCSLKAECYDGYLFPFMLLDHVNCMLTIDPVDVPIGSYSFGIQVSDYIGESFSPLSTIPLKFTVQVIPVSSCTYS